MKIEKLNDRQIRCTLRQSDLASRHLKISELAYGSAKAKALFRDIMQQAYEQLGFESDDLPLMIEAIPVSSDCIVLIVTKVEEPEELDTRFSKFSSSEDEESEDGEYESYSYDDDDSDTSTHNNLSASEELEFPDETVAKNVLDIFNTVKDLIEGSLNKTNDFREVESAKDNKDNKNVKDRNNVPVKPEEEKHVARVFSFDSFDHVSDVSKQALLLYNDRNSLYKDNANSRYYLVLEKNSCDAISFNKVCNLLSEYASKEYSGEGRVNFFDEHYSCLCKDRALQVLSKE